MASTFSFMDLLHRARWVFGLALATGLAFPMAAVTPENSTYENPILAGDHPDPSVLKLGQDYYMVHSSFESVPGLLIWHSKDLVHWEPVGPALTRYVGDVWAPDLSCVNGRFFIYFPALGPQGVTTQVVYADSIHGPWSDPIDLHFPYIDPGHVVTSNGSRYLFFAGGYMAPLAADGLSATGPAKKVYAGWQYPASWDVETFAQEGPKVLHHGDYYYMVLAEGGTAGPPTSHMVIMARSKAIDGPWENSPYNPVVHTRSAAEKWWSRGHATLVEGPDGRQWYLVYHAYENGYYDLGRQTLLEPVEWTSDGWVKALEQDVAGPIPLPRGGEAIAHVADYSDDFVSDKVGIQWTFFHPQGPLSALYRIDRGTLHLKATGTSPKDASPLTFITGDHAYEIQAEIDADAGATGGLLLFYSERLFAGLGFSDNRMLEFSKGDTQFFDKPPSIHRHYFIRLRNDHHIVTVWYSPDGHEWTKHWMQFEVSGYHHNVAGGFLSLRPALLAVGAGEVRIQHFRYTALRPVP